MDSTLMSSDFNILQPSTIWISNRCYRVLLPGSANIGGAYIEDEAYPDNTYKDEVECQLEFDIPFDQLSNGRIRTSFAVASSYLPYIIGTRGATKHRIENETYTQIKIPSKGQVGDVVIIGKDLKTVRQARIKIEMLVDQAKRRQPFTHFVSIPFNEDLIKENFMKFKDEVLERCQGDRGVEASLFQIPSKLHMTICALVLSDDRERQEAVKALKDCHLEIMKEYFEEPLRVEVKGIEYLNDDPSEVDVLYGKVQTASWAYSLQEIVDDLVRKLVKKGVSSKQYENVKLHVTLMNTLFRSDKDGTASDIFSNKDKGRETFDARNILNEFRDFYFGEIEITELHLSVRYSTAANGYYSSSCKLSLIS